MVGVGLCRCGDRRGGEWLVGNRYGYTSESGKETQGFADIVAHTYNPYTQETEARGLITRSKAV